MVGCRDKLNFLKYVRKGQQNLAKNNNPTNKQHTRANKPRKPMCMSFTAVLGLHSTRPATIGWRKYRSCKVPSLPSTTYRTNSRTPALHFLLDCKTTKWRQGRLPRRRTGKESATLLISSRTASSPANTGSMGCDFRKKVPWTHCDVKAAAARHRQALHTPVARRQPWPLRRRCHLQPPLAAPSWQQPPAPP